MGVKFDRIKLTHKKTGITAEVFCGRSMLDSRNMALKLLRSRIYAAKNLYKKDGH